jgi:hypothetical protein
MGLTAGTLGVVTSLAGCNSSSDGDAGDNQTGGNTSDEGNQTGAGDEGTPPDDGFDTPAYTRWLYAPGTVQDEQHSFFNYIDHGQIQADRDVLGDTYDQIATFANQFPFEQAGVTYEDIDTTLFHNVSRVTTGTFDREAVVTALESRGFEQVGERAGYTLLTGGDSVMARGAVAVETDTFVSTAPFGETDGPGPRAAVEATVDARRGASDRYAETNTAMARTTAALGTGTNVSVSTQEPAATTDISSGTFEGMVADGIRGRIDGETTTLRLVLLFADSSAIAVDDIETWTANSQQFEAVSGVSVSTSGSKAVITGEAETGPFLTE